ncbi:hypothetical protein [Streptomyces sp. NPDC051994]|uniref:hypothetical protein n=1 Tax=unclassified Streptomyces TaxID=2593676 RepID=UPI00343F645B
MISSSRSSSSSSWRRGEIRDGEVVRTHEEALEEEENENPDEEEGEDEDEDEYEGEYADEEEDDGEYADEEEEEEEYETSPPRRRRRARTA